MSKKIMLSVVASAVLLAASANNALGANVYNITNVAFSNGSETITVPGPGGGTFLAGRFTLAGTNTSVSPPSAATLFAYCIDLDHTISLGSVNYTVTEMIPPFSFITQSQLERIGWLAVYGDNFLSSSAAAADKQDVSAAVQGLIWEVLTGTTVSSSDTGAQAQITSIRNTLNAVTNFSGYTGLAYSIFEGNTRRQMLFSGSFIGGGDPGEVTIPEPVSILLLGIGLLGLGLAMRMRYQRFGT